MSIPPPRAIARAYTHRRGAKTMGGVRSSTSARTAGCRDERSHAARVVDKGDGAPFAHLPLAGPAGVEKGMAPVGHTQGTIMAAISGRLLLVRACRPSVRPIYLVPAVWSVRMRA